MNDDESKLLALLKDYAAKANAGDLEGWLSLWCEDGVQMPNDAPARIGIGSIREAMAPVFSDLRLHIEIHDVWAARVEATMGYTHCDYSISATPREGKDALDIMRDGKALTVYKRQRDGSWRIAYDCVNSNIA
ncbi:MAG: DUF4440 domain-containing protein [Pseudomonadota bacterium]